MSFWESVQLAFAFNVSGAVPLFWSKVKLQVGGAGGVAVMVWLAEPFSPLLSVVLTVAVNLPAL